MTVSGVASPCIDVCRMDPRSGLCEGCLRTLDEIAAWGTLSDAGKQAVWQRLELRRRTEPLPATPGNPAIKQAAG
jgi:predicted Fe-S protein YdhL (DUF1289 family)